MSLQPLTCPTCHLPRESRSSGRITQWLTTCSCNLKAPEDQTKTIDLCVTCGKRIREGRTGTFTQFVFRFDLCSCDVPQYMIPKVEASPQIGKDDLAKDEEEELAVEADEFPVERYKPLEMVGKGSTGTVYFCRDRLLRKRVTVKTLRIKQAEHLVSFQKEAKVLCKLDHPNIVRILDFGATSGGTPYMVLEYTPGRSLDYHIQHEGPLSWFNALSVFTSLSAALEYCHTRNVYHRDLKPSNVLMTSNGDISTVKLFDFGVAEVQSENAESQHATIVGTPSYMAPDQALGKEFDARSEIYSFGCMLFETLTGAPPFTGSTPLEILSKHANNAPPPLPEQVPSSLNSVVAKCLAKHPDDRFQSMHELGLALISIFQESCTSEAYPDEFSSQRDDGDSHHKLKEDGQYAQQIKVLVLASALILIGFAWFALAPLVTEPPIETLERAKELPASSLVGDMMADRLNVVNGIVRADQDFSDADMDDLLKLRGHTQLSLAGSRVTGKRFSILRKLRNLEELDLANTRIDDAALKHIGKLSQLKKLKLDRTAIGDDGVRHLANLQGLYYLSLSETNVTDAGIDSIRKMTGLRELLLTDTNITETALQKLNTMNLRFLNLWECQNVKIESVDAYQKHHPWCAVTYGPASAKIRNKEAFTSASESTLTPARKAYNELVMKYRGDFHQPEFRNFFLRHDAFKQRKDYSDLKNKRLVQCLQDPLFKEAMKDSYNQSLWSNPEYWKQLEALNNRFESLLDNSID